MQNFVRDVLRDIFTSLEPDDIKSQTMGMTGEDIVLSPAARKEIPYSFECKNVERFNVWDSIKQCEDNCNKQTPVVVFKRNRSKTYAIIDFDHFMELISEKRTTK